MRYFFFFLALACIILLSFFLYSFNYSPVFNSDGAVNVLMTYYFKLPRDLYYWGQDRWGSLIPLIAQFFYRVCHLSPVTSVSLTNYSILIAGYIGFCGVLKTRFSRIIFAIIWFLPPLRFIDIVWYATGVQYSLVAISVSLINKLKSEPTDKKQIQNHLILICLMLVFILCVWVSDASVSTIFILLSVTCLYNLKKKVLLKQVIFYTTLGLAGGVAFFHYAKEHVMNKTGGYLAFNGISEIKESLMVIKKAFLDLLCFRVNETYMGIYTYLVFFLLIYTGILFFKRKFTLAGERGKWVSFFLSDGVIVFLIAIVSHWVFSNGVSRRYFFGSYISLSVVFLLLVEHAQLRQKTLNLFKCLIFATVIIGSASPVHYIKYVWLKSLRPQYETFSELKQLGQIGVIADYWHSYIAACTDPGKIKAIPNDQEFVRNPEMIDEVFTQPKLYVIRDNWMDSFPDTLKQFGRTLIKEGSEFRIAGCDVNKYRKLNGSGY